MTLQAIADTIKTLAGLGGILSIAYCGVMIISSNDPIQRNQYKDAIATVFIGLCIVFIAPVISSVLAGGKYCG